MIFKISFPKIQNSFIEILLNIYFFKIVLNFGKRYLKYHLSKIQNNFIEILLNIYFYKIVLNFGI